MVYIIYGVYHIIGYSNEISQRRGGTWHIALTDITMKVISDAIIRCDLCQDSAVNNRLIPVLRFLLYLRKNDSVIFTNPYYIPIATSIPVDHTTYRTTTYRPGCGSQVPPKTENVISTIDRIKRFKKRVGSVIKKKFRKDKSQKQKSYW